MNLCFWLHVSVWPWLLGIERTLLANRWKGDDKGHRVKLMNIALGDEKYLRKEGKELYLLPISIQPRY